MGKFTIHKAASLAMLVIIMFVFFIWLAQQAADLALFFGFRSSNTIANDIASLITSVSAVPGEATLSYNVGGGTDTISSECDEDPEKCGPNERSESGGAIKYDVEISGRTVCVTSNFDSQGRATTDCASFPYDVTDGVEIEGVTEFCLSVSKTFGEQAPEPSSEIDSGSAQVVEAKTSVITVKEC